jgi:hypothetical protein
VDRAEIFKSQSREVALMHARTSAYAKGRGFILRQNDSAAARASLERAAENFALSDFPEELTVSALEQRAFYAVQPDDAQRWWMATLADIAPRSDALDYFESARDVKDMMEIWEFEEEVWQLGTVDGIDLEKLIPKAVRKTS